MELQAGLKAVLKDVAAVALKLMEMTAEKHKLSCKKEERITQHLCVIIICEARIIYLCILFSFFCTQEMVRTIQEQSSKQFKADERCWLRSVLVFVIISFSHYSSVSNYNKEVKKEIMEQVLHSPDGDKKFDGKSSLVDSIKDAIFLTIIVHGCYFLHQEAIQRLYEQVQREWRD